jgi:hypothetical protein
MAASLCDLPSSQCGKLRQKCQVEYRIATLRVNLSSLRGELRQRGLLQIWRARPVQIFFAMIIALSPRRDWESLRLLPT